MTAPLIKMRRCRHTRSARRCREQLGCQSPPTRSVAPVRTDRARVEQSERCYRGGERAMSDPVSLTDEYVYRVAPDGKSAHAALELLRRGAFRDLRVSADGTRLEGRCQGSDPQPYGVQVNLSNPDQPETG